MADRWRTVGARAASGARRRFRAAMPVRDSALAVAVFVRTLHPNIPGRAFVWRPGEAVQVRPANFGLFESEEFRNTCGKISLVTRKSPAPARSQINVSRYGPYRSWPISLNGELARKPRASMRNVVSESRRPLGPRRGVFMVTPGASVILVVEDEYLVRQSIVEHLRDAGLGRSGSRDRPSYCDMRFRKSD